MTSTQTNIQKPLVLDNQTYGHTSRMSGGREDEQADKRDLISS